jgi:hypothetical protein
MRRRRASPALYAAYRQCDVDALVTLADDQAAPDDDRAAALSFLREFHDERVTELCCRLLREEPSARLRGRAARALRDTKGVAGHAALVEAMNDDSANVRYFAVESLAATGRRDAVSLVRAALNDEDKIVRASAARGLGELGDVEAIPLLAAAIKDDVWVVATTAIGARRKFESAEALDALQRAQPAVRFPLTKLQIAGVERRLRRITAGL